MLVFGNIICCPFRRYCLAPYTVPLGPSLGVKVFWRFFSTKDGLIDQWMKIINDQGICRTAPVHWCLKSIKSGFARAKVPCLKYLDVLSARIDAKNKQMALSRTLKCATRGLQRLTDLFGLQVYLSLIWKAYSHQPLKLQWSISRVHCQPCFALHGPQLWLGTLGRLHCYGNYSVRECQLFVNICTSSYISSVQHEILAEMG